MYLNLKIMLIHAKHVLNTIISLREKYNVSCSRYRDSPKNTSSKTKEPKLLNYKLILQSNQTRMKEFDKINIFHPLASGSSDV